MLVNYLKSCDSLRASDLFTMQIVCFEFIAGSRNSEVVLIIYLKDAKCLLLKNSFLLHFSFVVFPAFTYLVVICL